MDPYASTAFYIKLENLWPIASTAGEFHRSLCFSLFAFVPSRPREASVSSPQGPYRFRRKQSYSPFLVRLMRFLRSNPSIYSNEHLRGKHKTWSPSRSFWDPAPSLAAVHYYLSDYFVWEKGLTSFYSSAYQCGQSYQHPLYLKSFFFIQLYRLTRL